MKATATGGEGKTWARWEGAALTWRNVTDGTAHTRLFWNAGDLAEAVWGNPTIARGTSQSSEEWTFWARQAFRLVIEYKYTVLPANRTSVTVYELTCQ